MSEIRIQSHMLSHKVEELKALAAKTDGLTVETELTTVAQSNPLYRSGTIKYPGVTVTWKYNFEEEIAEFLIVSRLSSVSASSVHDKILRWF